MAVTLLLPRSVDAAIADAPRVQREKGKAVEANVEADAPRVQLQQGKTVEANAWDAEVAGALVLEPPSGNTETTLELANKNASWFETGLCELSKRDGSFKLKRSSESKQCDGLWEGETEIGARLGGNLYTVKLKRPAMRETLLVRVTEDDPNKPARTTPTEGVATREKRRVIYPRFLPQVEEGFYYFMSAGEWKRSSSELSVDQASGRIAIPSELAELLVRAAVYDAPLKILVRREGELQELRIQIEATTGSPLDPQEFPFVKQCMCELSKLTNNKLGGCGAAASLPNIPDPRTLRKERRKAVRKEWEYLVCVDMTTPTSPRVMVRTTRAHADSDAESGGVHLFSGRRLQTRVWYPEGHEVVVALTGDAQTVRQYIYDPNFNADAGTVGVLAPAAKPYTQAFHGRKAGAIKLSVEVSSKSSGGRTFKYEHPFSVTDVYLAALRISAGFSWAPWDRRYTAVSNSDPANPGKHVGVSEGNPGGLGYAEFLAGGTVFFSPVFEGERTVTGGLYLGLGLLATDGKGLDAISSLHAGPELVLGRDFGIAPTVSLRRTKGLRDAYAIGSPIGDGEAFEHPWFTWSFGLVLNLGPRFWKTVGTARKGLGA